MTANGKFSLNLGLPTLITKDESWASGILLAVGSQRSYNILPRCNCG
jgi:hypothetical protein